MVSGIPVSVKLRLGNAKGQDKKKIKVKKVELKTLSASKLLIGCKN